MIELRLLCPVQHQPHPAAVEECQTARRPKKQLQTQDVLIESRRAFNIFCVDGDLSKAGDSNSGCKCFHDLTSSITLVSIANYIRWQKSSTKISHRALKPSEPRIDFIPPPSTCCA